MTVSYFVGTGIVSAAGWILGTAAGATAGSLLPASAGAVLGVMLYGMFVAIVIPQAKQEKSIFVCMIIAMVLSSLFAWMPQLKCISGGLAIVICTVMAAALAAVLSPIDEEENA